MMTDTSGQWRTEPLIENQAPNYLTLHEVAQILRCSYRTVRRYVSYGELTCLKLDRRLLVPRAVLDDWLRKKERA